MVTMIVTKVVECSRLSVRMGKKKKQEWVGKGRKALPHVFAQSLPLIFSHSDVFFLFVPTDSVEKAQKVSHIHCDFLTAICNCFYKIIGSLQSNNTTSTRTSKNNRFNKQNNNLFAIFVLLRCENA